MSNIWISFYRHVTNDVWKKKEKKQQQTLTTLFSLLVLLSKHENIYLRPIFTGKKITTAFALPQMASPSHGSDEHVEMVVSSPRGDVTVDVFLECVFLCHIGTIRYKAGPFAGWIRFSMNVNYSKTYAMSKDISGFKLTLPWLRFSKTRELWNSKANWRLRISLPSII